MNSQALQHSAPTVHHPILAIPIHPAASCSRQRSSLPRILEGSGRVWGGGGYGMVHARGKIFFQGTATVWRGRRGGSRAGQEGCREGYSGNGREGGLHVRSILRVYVVIRVIFFFSL